MKLFSDYESEVRSYIRSFPVVFDRADGSIIWDDQGNEYLDFFAGAGTLNYGHNPKAMNQALISYLNHQGILHSLDKATVAKQKFIEKFYQTIIKPRGLDYKIQFTGPTGTNAVEAAIKLARRVTQRGNVIAFTQGYHGLTMGALAITANDYYHQQIYASRTNVYHAPYDGYFGETINTANYIRQLIEDSSSGVSMPAAIILETIQGEGGVNTASKEWLQEIEKLCREKNIFLIIDDIQVGNGRSGEFFSFEFAGIKPDIVCMSKSIGGGLPLAFTLIKPELDQWLPGEHTGTFRGNNLAFVAAAELLTYWDNDELSQAVLQKGHMIKRCLEQFVSDFPQLKMSVRGRGMIWGLEIPVAGFAKQLSRTLFENKLLVETCGKEDSVVKILPPLIIKQAQLEEGLSKIGKGLQMLASRENVAA
ncbi:diaminobutyrate--2-oxoglutarate transaminase [Spartinivicinus poritis]|uniref:Diaminobutyrate--2-oxoglutarate transaminase n=1 Tax=Spartinivicinus poritis TaxID=2994640 RepID=A0ABT5UH49_9GAMM|nr:diaminobutyrate--2-oxoglutarate transaminase [Spartinivicinus sp. A2-2]MDE1465683.1 diaminobutyrate--2-oxoglutarate transaminase [Spartinivicinus sp. A2-2]